MENIIKIVKSFEESTLLIKVIRKTIKSETKEQKGRFLPMLIGTLAASLLGSRLTERGVIRASDDTIRADDGIIRAGEDTIRAGQDFYCLLIL